MWTALTRYSGSSYARPLNMCSSRELSTPTITNARAPCEPTSKKIPSGINAARIGSAPSTSTSARSRLDELATAVPHGCTHRLHHVGQLVHHGLLIPACNRPKHTSRWHRTTVRAGLAGVPGLRAVLEPSRVFGRVIDEHGHAVRSRLKVLRSHFVAHVAGSDWVRGFYGGLGRVRVPPDNRIGRGACVGRKVIERLVQVVQFDPAHTFAGHHVTTSATAQTSSVLRQSGESTLRTGSTAPVAATSNRLFVVTSDRYGPVTVAVAWTATVLCVARS